MTVWIAIKCPDCHSTDIIKHGKSSENKQRYLCQNSECLRRTFILDYTYLGRRREVKQQIVEMSLNSSGIRDIARVLAVGTPTVIREAILTKFIQSNLDARELKRAMAVKMALLGEPYSKITELLEINKSSITMWKQRFLAQGLNGIKLGYRGAKSYLDPAQRVEVINWLKTRDFWNLDELVTYLDEHYAVIYQSKQSYYELMSAANITWRKSQKVNPNSDPELVKKREKKLLSFLVKIKLKFRLDS